MLGVGGVGGYYGVRLAAAGLDVHFLLRSDYDHVRQHGLVLRSVDGDLRLPQVNAYGDARRMPRCDVVCIAIKATANDALAQLLPPVLGEDGLALLLQNGLGGEDEVARIAGPDRVMGGLCFLCSTKTGPGEITHLDYGAVKLAEYSADGTPRGITGRMRAIASDLEKAGIPVFLSEDLLEARWRKLVWNVPFNGLSVTRHSTTDQLMADPETVLLIRELMREVLAGAAACGRTIEDGFVEKMLEDTRKMAPYSPSMRVDWDKGRPMEVEAIFGNPLRAAESRGARLPRLRALYEELSALNEGTHRRP